MSHSFKTSGLPGKVSALAWVTGVAAVSNEARVANIISVETQMDLGLQLAAAQVPGKQKSGTSMGHDTKLNLKSQRGL